MCLCVCSIIITADKCGNLAEKITYVICGGVVVLCEAGLVRLTIRFISCFGSYGLYLVQCNT